MTALDDILGKGGDSTTRKLLQVAPPPAGASLQGAPNFVSSQPTSQTSAPQQPTSAPTSTQPQARQVPRTDATAVVGNSGTEQPHLSYVQMYEMLNPNKPETAEERAKREKREKSEAALATVGDSISALSNLWFTSRYAPNAYDPSKGMSATTKARWDKLRQEREARRREYADGYMRALAMDEAKNREDRNWRHTIEREKIADQRYEAKAAQDKALADLNEQLKRHQITAAEYKAEQERIKAQFAEQNEMLDLGYKQAGIQQRRAAAGASNAKANYYRNGGSGGSNRNQVHHFNGKTYYGTTKDYEKDVYAAARAYNARHRRIEKNSETNGNVTVSSDKVIEPINLTFSDGSRQRMRDAAELASEVERLLEEERKEAEGTKQRHASANDRTEKRKTGVNWK